MVFNLLIIIIRTESTVFNVVSQLVRLFTSCLPDRHGFIRSLQVVKETILAPVLTGNQKLLVVNIMVFSFTQ